MSINWKLAFNPLFWIGIIFLVIGMFFEWVRCDWHGHSTETSNQPAVLVSCAVFYYSRHLWPRLCVFERLMLPGSDHHMGPREIVMDNHLRIGGDI